MDSSQLDLQKFFHSYIVKYVPGWKNIKPEQLIVQNTVGITNKTYIIKQGGGFNPDAIIFRHFGENCEGNFIDRKDELKIVSHIGNIRLGPTFYGAEDRDNIQIRIEFFIDSDVMESSNMKNPKYYRKVAINLAKFHKIDIDLNRKPILRRVLEEENTILKIVREKISKKEIFSQQELKMLEEAKNFVSQEEIHFLLSQLPKGENCVGFCHNDLLANNILLKKKDQSIVFIDFEYSSYNYKCFDIGNYFAESQFDYMNPDPPYYYLEDKMIQLDLVQDFVETYVVSDHIQQEKEEQLIELGGKQYLNEELGQEVEKRMKEFQIGCMLSNFYWGIWGIHMSHSVEIDFDYIRFSRDRYRKYKQIKDSLIKQ